MSNVINPVELEGDTILDIQKERFLIINNI